MKTNKASGVFYAELDTKNAEIAALREALDGVRWDRYRCVGGGAACIECAIRRVEPEAHASSCKIGKLFAKGEKHEPN